MIKLNENKKIYKNFKQEIAIINFESEINNEYYNKRNILGGYEMRKKIIATVCGCFILISGVVLAKNIENITNNFRGLGNGIDSAANSGYIDNTERNFVNSKTTIENKEKVIKDIDIDTRVKDFIMDDMNLSTQFELKFNNKISEIINFENIDDIELRDLIILDEENRIIYGGKDKEKFEEFCKYHKLDYSFGNCNENYLNCGLNYFLNDIKDEDTTINLLYNIYTEKFPKSKKLSYNFTQIIISEKNKEDKIKLEGNWSFEVDVPENMYNRTKQYYKVVSCDKENFNIYSASLCDTGFEIGIQISNLQMPERLEIEELKQISNINEDLKNGKISQKKAEELKEKYDKYMYLRTPISISKSQNEKASYVENSKGDIFESTLSPSRRAKGEWIDNNNYDFYETFSMNKYNSTDKIKVVLFYYGEPVTIELEKK